MEFLEQIVDEQLKYHLLEVSYQFFVEFFRQADFQWFLASPTSHLPFYDLK
jgi:hypothetical protein